MKEKSSVPLKTFKEEDKDKNSTVNISGISKRIKEKRDTETSSQFKDESGFFKSKSLSSDGLSTERQSTERPSTVGFPARELSEIGPVYSKSVVIKHMKNCFLSFFLISIVLFSGCRGLGKDGTPKEGIITSAGTSAVTSDPLKNPAVDNNGSSEKAGEGGNVTPDDTRKDVAGDNSNKIQSEAGKIGENNGSENNTGNNRGNDTGNKEGVSEKRIVCEIKGEVVNPGVYTLREGDRVNDIIVMAGGLTEDSSLDFINRASCLFDGQSVIIPYRNMSREEYDCLMALGAGDKNGVPQESDREPGINFNGGENKNPPLSSDEKNNGQSIKTDASAKASEKQGNKDTGDNKININTADSSELEKIPGVGPKTAEKIITYRETIAPFASIEEIKNVDRIGDKTFIKMQPYITVE